MKNLPCFFLAACLLLGSCDDQTESVSSASGAAPFSEPAAVSRPLEAPAGPSCVEALAADIVGSRGLSAEQGEPAVRALYHYLIETVWFADPVGLDTWRYMTPNDQVPLPFLDNRALSPLLFGIGSCEDFSAAMVLLLRAAGFEAEYVAGFTLSVDREYIDHAWAVVRLEGRWYHIDPQLEQNVTRDGALAYRYYLKSDDVFGLDHKWGENLIAYWPDMPGREKTAIRENHTPPACPRPYDPSPAPVQILLPPRPDRADVERRVDAIKRESGKGELPFVWLDVEPPVLVAERHVTPPLLERPDAVTPSSYRHGQSFLTGEAAALYRSLPAFVEANAPQRRLELSAQLTDVDVLFVIDTFMADNPAYYWADLSLVRTEERRCLQLSRRGSSDALARQKAEIEARAGEILAGSEGSSPFLRALAIHDALASVPYDRNETGQNSDNLYGVLVEGAATCYGYANGFQYLAQRAGLDCVLLKGHTPRGVGHAWNAVRLDGSWHFVDVTWDRPTQGEDAVYHDFFLMTTRETLGDRRWDERQYPALPKPAEGFAGYYRRMGFAVSGALPGDAVKRVAAIFYRQLAGKAPFSSESSPSFVEMKVEGTPEEYRAWKEWYVKALFEIQREIQAMADENGDGFILCDPLAATCHFNDATQVLTLYPAVKSKQ